MDFEAGPKQFDHLWSIQTVGQYNNAHNGVQNRMHKPALSCFEAFFFNNLSYMHFPPQFVPAHIWDVKEESNVHPYLQKTPSQTYTWTVWLFFFDKARSLITIW